MRRNTKRCFFLLNFLVPAMVCAQRTLSSASSPWSVSLNSDQTSWSIQKASRVAADGSVVSTAAYQPKGWLPAVVPGTILTNLVANKIYADPDFGDVNRRSNQLIPDIADSGREFYHYWYRTKFAIPTTFVGKHIWLKLHGINYRSAIWLNGHKLGTMAGMFITKAFDITADGNRRGANYLAVDVLPVDVTGQSGPKKNKITNAAGENSNGGDGEIGRNVTMLMSVGWDFSFPDGVRDRNTGIWRDVELYATGDLKLEDPFVMTRLPLPDTNSSKQTVAVSIYNAANTPRNTSVEGMIRETGTKFSKEVYLNPGEHKTITFNPEEYPQLVLYHPKLWWPVNKGAQYLYHLQLTAKSGGVVNDQKTIRFGIREVTSDQNTPDKSRRFLVNGQPIFIRGTNWVPEAMLRNSVTRTYAELRYTRQAGVNMLRLWGGGIAESDYFYDLCDEMGFLVWNEYWITADTHLPTDTAMYLSNLASTLKRERNHPSLVYHVSSNESIEMPGAAALIHELDPSRGYQMESECCGVHDGSPYKYENPMQYFENTASSRGSRIDGFNPEYGTVCLPVLSSLKKMMRAKDLWPINTSVWNYMDGGGFHQVTTKYREAVDNYGKSKSIDEFSQKAQFAGALGYRAIWEVWNYNKFGFGDRWASGFFFWYNNNPVAQTAGRLYDWYLEPTAALYYSQNGLEPLHAQFDYLKNTVSVYNDFRQEFKDYHLVAMIYDLDARYRGEQSVKVNIPADGTVKDALKLDFPADISPVHFIRLSLQNAAGKEVANSFYWRSTAAYKGAWTLTGPAVSGFEAINKLRPAKLQIKTQKKDKHIYVTVTNTGNTLSFFTQLQLKTAGGKPLEPVFYTDNFFCLLPAESKQVDIDFSKTAVKTSQLLLTTDAFNTSKQTTIVNLARHEQN